MEYIKSTDFDQSIAMEDIFYCFENAYSRADYNVGFDNDQMFESNPHFYLNSSDNVRMAVMGNVKPNSSVLTVAGGGAYMFDSILNGATKIVNYDINSIQYYVLCLKIWAMKQLEYADYLNFLTSFNSSFLNHKILRRVIDNYQECAAYPFWDYFTKARRIEENALQELKFNPIIGAAILAGKVTGKANNELVNYFLSTEVGPSLMPRKFKAIRLIQCAQADSEAFGYLATKENYELVKERLDSVDISFVLSNVVDIRDKVDDKFDTIFLSNIPFYLAKETIISLIDETLISMLNEDGRISAYHQGMRLEWFKKVVKEEKFKISRKDFDMASDAIQLNIAGVHNVLLSHRALVDMNYAIQLTEIPTYGGAPEMKPDTDILALIKKNGDIDD